MPTTGQLTDEELMHRYVDGDVAAFEELYRRFSPRVYKYVLQRVRNAASADELLQTIFLKFHRSRASFRQGEAVAPWLFTLARNCTHDWGRRNSIAAEARERLAAETTAAPVPPEEGLLAHPALSERERQILALRFEQDLPFARVGELMGSSAVSVRQAAHRAIAKLKRALGGE